ncbi:MAG: hypothetical protein ACO1N9_13795 [Flavobacterium sp.]
MRKHRREQPIQKKETSILKIIFFMGLAAIAAYVIFFMKDDRPDLSGDWQVKHIIIGEKDILPKVITADTFPIKLAPLPLNMLYIRRNAFNLRWHRREDIPGKISFPDKKTVVIASDFNMMMNDTYSVMLDTTEQNSQLDIKMVLSSENKAIELHKFELINQRNKALEEINSIKGRAEHPKLKL